MGPYPLGYGQGIALPFCGDRPVPVVESDVLLTTEEAAASCGLSPVTLKAWRWKKNPHAPPHLRVSSRSIRYSAAALERWKASRTVHPSKKSSRNRRST
jgi:predicted DNA-binding transcriptional regulator AlpA